MTKKCAFIRSDRGGHKRCPFGLPIDKACRHAGDSVRHMVPVEEVKGKEEAAEKANKRVYLYSRTNKPCPFAANIIDDMDSVNCNYGDHAAGTPLSSALIGSPLYPQTFSGIGMDGLYAFPMGFYADNNESRNLFTGLFSLVGEAAPSIIKTAVKKAAPTIWDKIEKGDILLPKEQDELNDVLRDLKDFFGNKGD
jgi:hypothetical protein